MDVIALKQHVANVVLEHRKRLGMTQEELADAVALSTTTISRIERAEYLPTLEKVYEISVALEIHPIELMKGDSIVEFLQGLPREQLVELRNALGKALTKKA